MYVLPSDSVDRTLDTDGTIEASVRNWQTWLRGQTGGRAMRVDTIQGDLDVTFTRLPRPDAFYAAKGVFLRDAIDNELKAAGLTDDRKIYLVYYDGSNTAVCGGGAWPPTLRGNVAAVYMRATFGAGFLCYTPALSLSGLQIMDYAGLHEVMHTIGLVATCAPHHTRSGHVSDSPSDLMYAGDEPWTPSVLDVGRDDYFDAPVVGCLDLADSPFLSAATNEPKPPSKQRLTVLVDGPGRVIGGGVSCKRRCTALLPRGTRLTLRAVPAATSRLVRWSGACRGTRSCRLVMNAPHSVRATFAR
jgi:List-Bact-rpt repeat protein